MILTLQRQLILMFLQTNITFGDDGEKIEGNGTNLVISSSADLDLTATTDINMLSECRFNFW